MGPGCRGPLPEMQQAFASIQRRSLSSLCGGSCGTGGPKRETAYSASQSIKETWVMGVSQNEGPPSPILGGPSLQGGQQVNYLPFTLHLGEASRKRFSVAALSPPLPFPTLSSTRIQRARAFGLGAQRAPIGGTILCPANGRPLPIKNLHHSIHPIPPRILVSKQL